MGKESKKRETITINGFNAIDNYSKDESFRTFDKILISARSREEARNISFFETVIRCTSNVTVQWPADANTETQLGERMWIWWRNDINVRREEWLNEWKDLRLTQGWKKWRNEGMKRNEEWNQKREEVMYGGRDNWLSKRINEWRKEENKKRRNEDGK